MIFVAITHNTNETKMMSLTDEEPAGWCPCFQQKKLIDSSIESIYIFMSMSGAVNYNAHIEY